MCRAIKNRVEGRKPRVVQRDGIEAARFFAGCDAGRMPSSQLFFHPARIAPSKERPNGLPVRPDRCQAVWWKPCGLCGKDYEILRYFVNGLAVGRSQARHQVVERRAVVGSQSRESEERVLYKGKRKHNRVELRLGEGDLGVVSLSVVAELGQGQLVDMLDESILILAAPARHFVFYTRSFFRTFSSPSISSPVGNSRRNSWRVSAGCPRNRPSAQVRSKRMRSPLSACTIATSPSLLTILPVIRFTSSGRPRKTPSPVRRETSRDSSPRPARQPRESRRSARRRPPPPGPRIRRYGA